MQDKTAACQQRLDHTTTDLRKHADILDHLRADIGTADPTEHYTRILAALSQLHTDVRRHRESMAFIANAEPDRLPITTTANALGISVNTLRSWLPRLNATPTLDDPFQER